MGKFRAVLLSSITITGCCAKAGYCAEREHNPPARLVPVVTLESQSPMEIGAAFENTSGKPLTYLLAPDKRSVDRLEFLLMKGRRVVNPLEMFCYAALSKNDVRKLAPGRSIVHTIHLRKKYGDVKPGQYELRAKYDMKKDNGLVKEFGLTPLSFNRTVMILHIIESLPKKLNKLTKLKIKRVTESSHYFLGVDVGLGPVWDKNATLFIALRESAPGKAQLNDPPKKIFRPLRVDPKARVETMLYNPFPLSTEPIIQVHVLVTEPNKPQRHLVIGELSSGAAAAEIKKNETLKPGTLYKLHKDALGSVKLVPREKQ